MGLPAFSVRIACVLHDDSCRPDTEVLDDLRKTLAAAVEHVEAAHPGITSRDGEIEGHVESASVEHEQEREESNAEREALAALDFEVPAADERTARQTAETLREQVERSDRSGRLRCRIAAVDNVSYSGYANYSTFTAATVLTGDSIVFHELQKLVSDAPTAHDAVERVRAYVSGLPGVFTDADPTEAKRGRYEGRAGVGALLADTLEGEVGRLAQIRWDEVAEEFTIR